MSEVKWIKLSTQMFEDDKIRLIESMPESDTILIIWIKLLSQAGKTNASGYIYLNETIPFTDEMIATIFNRPIATVRLALKTFEKFGMIEITDENFINVLNWDKHQNLDGLEKIREQNRLRKQKEREKKRLPMSRDASHDGAQDVAPCHALELDIDKNINNIYSNDFEHFWKVYPRKVDKKKAYKSFNKAIKKFSLETILLGAEKYAKQSGTIEKKFIKHPATFLNNESFIDGFEDAEDKQDKPISNTSKEFVYDINAGEDWQ